MSVQAQSTTGEQQRTRRHVRQQPQNGEREVPPWRELRTRRASGGRPSAFQDGRLRPEAGAQRRQGDGHWAHANKGEQASRRPQVHREPREDRNEEETDRTREPPTRRVGTSTAEATRLGPKPSGEGGGPSRRRIPSALQRAQTEHRSSRPALQGSRNRDDDRSRNGHRRSRILNGTRNAGPRYEVNAAQAVKHDDEQGHRRISGSLASAGGHVHKAPAVTPTSRMQLVRRTAYRNPSRRERRRRSHERPTAGSKTRIRTAASSSR